MTIPEYNETIRKQTQFADVFIANLENAIQKTKCEEEVMHQLRCLGWNKEMRDTIRKALTCYRDVCKAEAKANARTGEEGSVRNLISELRKMGTYHRGGFYHNSSVADSAADLIDAYNREETEGRLLHLPCALGETVYKICPQAKHVQFGMMRNGKIVTSNCERCPWRNCNCEAIGFQRDETFEHIVMPMVVTNLEWLIRTMPYFGSIYFLSEEEAQTHLKAMEAQKDA